MNTLAVGLVALIVVTQVLRQFGAGFKMITAAHHQGLRAGIVGLKLVCFGVEINKRLVGIRDRPVSDVTVTIIEMSE